MSARSGGVPWLVIAVALFGRSAPSAAQGALGTARQFGVLGGSAVSNTGPTTIKGSLGVFPGTAITGQSSITLVGSVHQTDAIAQQAEHDAAVAFSTLSFLPFTSNLTGQNLGGMTLTPGVYSFAAAAQLTGNLVLDFQGDPSAMFVFQIGSALTTATGASVSILNGAPGGGVYWQVGSSATLGTATTFLGNIIADQSVTLTTGARVICGRAIALHAAITMDTNIISNDCSNGGDYGTGTDDFGSMGFSGALATTATPEPATVTLVVLPLVAMLTGFRRNRRSQA